VITLTTPTPSDPQPTTERHSRKGSDHDRNHHHHTVEHGAHTGNGDGSPTSNRPNSSPDDGGTRSDTDKPEHHRQSTPARRPRRESYAQQQARLDAEAVDRWAVIVVDWPPMTKEQIRALAVILNRIDARQAQQSPGGNRNG
jgi:hypothetical protein